jgi:general secretion pathway protein B
VPERTPVLFAELPSAIQQEIPKLSILFHLYSGNPKDRLVGINDRMLREGDPVAPGLVLEQVTPDGMVLSYKGYRFLHGTR